MNLATSEEHNFLLPNTQFNEYKILLGDDVKK